MIVCKTDHTEEGIPAFLCRTCHPELNMTEEERKAALKRERLAAKRAATLGRRQHEAALLEAKIRGLLSAKPGTARAKQRKKHEVKLSQLRKHLDKGTKKAV